MLDLGTLRLGIKVDSDEAKSELNKVGSAVEESGAKTDSLALKAKTMIKAFAAAWAVKEIVKLGKAALDAFAEFEQLEGGVNKIFGKEAAQDVMKNANRAYMTAGISANKYMEQVTSFSASLISSLGGDTTRAAEVADMAIQDMADNANTFGTSIESIQNAYSGFSRQNFTMLDNLKLGFAGSKEGMQQLLDKANEINARSGKITNYQIDNLNDIYQAIHVVQGELNITGTTAKEAASTIAGSMNMMKAAWQNLLIAIGTGEGLDAAVDNFLDALGRVAKNIIPRVVKIAGSVVKGLVRAIPKIMLSLANAISNYADTINAKAASKWLSAGLKLLLALVKGILQAAPKLVAAVAKLAASVLKSFSGINLSGAGKAIINSLLSGLKATWTSVKNWVADKVSWIKSMFGGAKASSNITSRYTGPQQRIGLREVPYDGYLATLHKGETVLTAAETNRYKEMLNAGGKTYNGGDVTIHVHPSPGMDENKLAAAVERKFIQVQNRRRLAWQ